MEKPDHLQTAKGNIVLQPVDHASLVVSQASHVIYVDPVGGAGRYHELASPTAILVTHEHGDHFDTATLEELVGNRQVPMLVSHGVFDKLGGKLKALATPIGYGEARLVSGLPVRAVEAYNTSPERLRYHPKGLGNGYVLTLGGLKVYVAGDTEPNPDMLSLTGIDVAFLPMNLPYTMLGEQAAEAVKVFRPRIVYPFHYSRGPEPQTFAKLLGGHEGVEVRLRDWYPQ